jgi:hypothetical protein
VAPSIIGPWPRRSGRPPSGSPIGAAGIFALSVIILAWAGVLLWRDRPGGGFGIALPVGIMVLNAALASLGMVQYHRNIARGGRAATGIAGTGEQQGQPTR